MLGVRLREHHELDVGRIAAERVERLREVVDLVGRQARGPARRWPRASAAGPCAAAEWSQAAGAATCANSARASGDVGEHRFGHPVVNERQQRRAIVVGQRRAIATSQRRTRRRARCAGRRRARSCARCRSPSTTTARSCRAAARRAATCRPQRRSRRAARRSAVAERRVLARVERALDFDEVPVTRRKGGDRMARPDRRQRGKKFRDPERRKRGSAAQGDDFGHEKV